MKLTAQEVIEKRKELWNKHHDIDQDHEFRKTIAEYLMKDKDAEGLYWEMFDYPENMIEIFFIIVNKDRKTVPFFMNEVQQEFCSILNKAIDDFKNGRRLFLRFLILKGRQQGFTSFITAYQTASAILHRNFSGFTLADLAENTETIFSEKAKLPYENIPECLQPTEQYNSRRELYFQNEKGTGLNSRWRVSTAGNEDVGRSKTINFFHGSEVAFWKNLQSILNSLGEALTQSCLAILESTANGINAFKDLWDDDNNWEPLFFEWWKTSEYRLNFESDDVRQSFQQSVEKVVERDDYNCDNPQWCFNRCKWLLEKKGLDWNQLYWYYRKWKDKAEDIKQEYPCTPEEAFLSSGRAYFNTEIVNKRLDELRALYKINQPKRGFFEYEYKTNPRTLNKIIDTDTIKWVDNPKGYITIYEEPEKTTGYTMGGDTSTEGSDRNCGQVIKPDATQAATLLVEMDEDLFAEQQWCLGWYYNWALIGDEINHSTHPIKVLREREYPNLYIRGSKDKPDYIADTGKTQQALGVRTTGGIGGNRSSMLSEVRTIVRDNIEKIRDITTLEEMMTFIINDQGKPEHEEGKHDDTILAYAIAVMIAPQQAAEIKPKAEELEGYYTEAELEDLGYSKHEIKRYMEGATLYKK